MNKYNEFFAYIENKRIREAEKQYLTLRDLNLFEGLDNGEPLFNKNLNGKNFYTLIYNFNEYINIINTYLMKWKGFGFGIDGNKGNLNKILNNNIEPIILAPNQNEGGYWMYPLANENLVEDYIKTTDPGDLNSNIVLAACFKAYNSNKLDLEKQFLFKVKNISGYNVFYKYNKNLNLKGLLSIFEPIPDIAGNINSYQSNFITTPGNRNNFQININEFTQFIENILKGVNENKNDKYSKENKNNISIGSGMNELQAKAAADIIIKASSDLFNEEYIQKKYKNIYLEIKTFLQKAKDRKNIKNKEDILKYNVHPSFLYIGYKPIQFQEKSYKAKINSTNSKEIGSELVECYFNFYLTADTEETKKELLQNLNNNKLLSFEKFSKEFFQELTGYIQKNKTTINDNNIIYTLGFKQGNYFKMENPLSCKFSIIVGKNVGKISYAGNVAQYLSNQSVANNSRNPRRSINLKNNY